MDSTKIPVIVWLTPEEIGLLDRAVAEWPDKDNSRARFALIAIRYALLSLAETGNLDIGNGEGVPEFVEWYRDVLRRIEAGEYIPTAL